MGTSFDKLVHDYLVAHGIEAETIHLDGAVESSVQLGVVHGGIGKFLMIFAVTQIPLAIAEGLLTVVVFNVLEKYSREELHALCVL